MAYIPKGADAYWHADDDHCPWCGEDGYSSRHPCCIEDLGGEYPDPDAYDDETHAARMAVFAGSGEADLSAVFGMRAGHLGSHGGCCRAHRNADDGGDDPLVHVAEARQVAARPCPRRRVRWQ